MLTIIIPSYKREHFLNKCILSIIGQFNSNILKKNIKLIIILNSKKNSLTEKIENKIKRKKLLYKFIYNKKNIGLTGSINKSVKISDTKYCMIIDDEIILKRGSVSELYNFLKDKSPKLLVGRILPYLDKKNLNIGKKNYLLSLKKNIRKDKYQKDYTLLDFGTKIKKIETKYAFMSLQVFNKDEYLKFGGYAPDGMSGEKIFMNGHGENSFNSKFKLAFYFPKLTGYHAIDNKIYKDYINERYFLYGINDSFIDIRSKNNFFLLKNLIKSYLKIIYFNKENKKYYFNKGYFMHLLNFYLSGSKFRKYCLSESYIDFNFSEKFNFFPFKEGSYKLW